MSTSRPDEPKLLPGCWLESPWDPGTAGTISEQSHLIDLIPLYKAQWLRYFLFWAILVGGTLALGALIPPMLNAMKIPVPDIIKLGENGLDKWLETILLLLTAGTSYLAWRIRRQKPECMTRGRILYFCVGIFLYMSLDRTAHCLQSFSQSINVVLPHLGINNVTLDSNNILFWETSVYGIVYLALLSRLMIEFSGASMAQLFLLVATAAYACSSGLWFAPDSLKLPLTIKELSGALTLTGDFFLFWSLVNYARFILLDGFGLDSDGWHTAITRYRYMSRHSSRRKSYIQSEAESSSEESQTGGSSSTEQTSEDANSAYASQFAYNVPSQSETSKPYQNSQYPPPLSSVTTTTASSPEAPYNSSSYVQPPYNQPYAQQPYGQQPYPQQQYNASPYNQTLPPQNPYEQRQPYGQPPFGQAPYISPQPSYRPQNAQPTQTNPANSSISGNSRPANASASENVNPSSAAASAAPTPEEVQKEFRILEEKIHRQLTHDEKKAVVRRMIRERQNK